MPSEGHRRSRKRWLEYQERRESENWSKMSYYDKVHVGDLVRDFGNNRGVVVATADTVERDQEPQWGDTHVLWAGRDAPTWEDCGVLEVVNEGG
jgi:hypothetical protein